MPEHFLRGGQQWHRDSRDQQGVLYFPRKFHENISPELYQEKCQKRAVACKCPRRKNKYPLALPPPQKGGKVRRQSLICCAQNASYCHWFSLSILKRLGFHKHENALIWTDSWFFSFSFLSLFVCSFVFPPPFAGSIWGIQTWNPSKKTIFHL